MKTNFLCVLLPLWLALASCRTAAPTPLSRHEFAEPHMGTLWRIILYAPDGLTASNAVRAAFDRVTALDRRLTDYDPDSELEQLRKHPAGTPVKVSEDLFEVLRRSQTIARQTEGAFDITAGPSVQLWRRARRQRALPPADRLAAALRDVGYDKLGLDARARTATLRADSMRLDVGGIAKGYGADAALQVLRKLGLPRALVVASGDLAIGDPPPGKRGWRVGVGAQDGRPDALATKLLLRNAGVSTSGDTEQFVEFDGVRYSHIVDPRTGLGLTNRVQATVIAECATRSDALATAVCVLGPERGLKMIEGDPRTAALILLPKDGSAQTSVQVAAF